MACGNIISLLLVAVCAHSTLAQVVTSVCQNTGLYYNPADCSSYYECVQAGSQPVLKVCGPGTVYNEFTQQCDWPRNVNCLTRTGPRPILLANPLPPTTIIRPVPQRNPVTVSITNPFGRLNINTSGCTSIARALYNTLRSQVDQLTLDNQCGQNCLDALPNFNVICNP